MNKEQPCDLIKKFIPELLKMINHTIIDGKERGVNFCPTNGDMELSNICVGERCNIPRGSESQRECKNKKSAIGSLHTHPSGHGKMSDNDIFYSVSRSEKFSCIGYMDVTKTIECYSYPYGAPKEEADKFKNILPREHRLFDDIQKYTIGVEGKYIRKSDTPIEQWKKMLKEAKLIEESKMKFSKYVNTDKAKEERSKNSCSIYFLQSTI